MKVLASLYIYTGKKCDLSTANSNTKNFKLLSYERQFNRPLFTHYKFLEGNFPRLCFSLELQ